MSLNTDTNLKTLSWADFKLSGDWLATVAGGSDQLQIKAKPFIQTDKNM